MTKQLSSDTRVDLSRALVAIALMAGAAFASPALAQDSDGDGVPDTRDVCPTTDMGLAVDGAGCDSFCEVADLSSDVFLRSRLLEIGTGAAGSFGSSIAPPAGWHQRVSSPASASDSLGFVANPQNDAWTVYNGDFFVPGTPEEGWGFQVDGGANRFNSTLMDENDIPGGFTGTRVECEPRVCGRRGGGSVFWSGARDNITVRHTYSVLNEGLFILIEATLTNTDSFAHTVTYYRNVDPDNQQPLTGDFDTLNTIVSQGDGTASSSALVTARTSAVAGASASFLALISSDPDARVSTGGFSNRSADQVWDCTGTDFLCTPGDSRTDDEAVSLAIRKTIPAGGSVTFFYAYTLDTVSVTTASACTMAAVCGDGNLEGTESCDDGNTTDGDGCDSECNIEDLPTCGNGLVEALEDCDDGNDMASDGCVFCEVEIGFVCTGEPSDCVPGTGGPGTACTADSECTDGRCVDGFCCESTCGGGSVFDCEACAAGDTGAANGLCRPTSMGRTCRTATDLCDAVEMCNGSGTACPADRMRPGGAICRDRVGPCDAAETCSGSSARCPLDGVVGASTVCRPAVGDCDLVEFCDGRETRCPPNAYADMSTVCRVAAASGCDVSEACTGRSPACPTDAFVADGTSCADSLACNGDELCGAGSCEAATAPSCDDANLCTSDMCAEPGGCASAPVAGCCNIDDDCNDSNVCTVDACSGLGGTCSGSPITGCCLSDGDCDDMNVCTAESCDLGTNRCVATPVAGCCASNADCGDSNACTTDTCDVSTGVCTNPGIVGCCLTDGDCDDTNTCTMDGCDTTTNTCTNDLLADCCLTDAECGDENICTTDTCNSVTAACVNDVISGCCAADSECDDADECTTNRCDTVTSTCAYDAIVGCGQMDGGVPTDGGVPVDAGVGLDGGVGVDDASTTGRDAAAASGDGSIGDAGMDTIVGGCGCRVTTPGGAPIAWLALFGALAFIRRRR